MRFKFLKLTYLILGPALFSSTLQSCVSTDPIGKLYVYAIGYKAVDSEYKQSPIPNEAEIVLKYDIGQTGYMKVWAENRTDKIMLVDKTKSFFRDISGISHSMADLAGYVKTTTDTESNSLYDSESTTSKSSSFQYGGNSIVSIVPHGRVLLATCEPISKLNFSNVSKADLRSSKNSERSTKKITKDGYAYGYENSPERFGCYVTYMFDDKINEQETIETNFYLASDILVPVRSAKGSCNDINAATRTILKNKPDIFKDDCWWFGYFDNSNGNNIQARKIDSNIIVLYDYK